MMRVAFRKYHNSGEKFMENDGYRGGRGNDRYSNTNGRSRRSDNYDPGMRQGGRPMRSAPGRTSGNQPYGSQRAGGTRPSGQRAGQAGYNTGRPDGRYSQEGYRDDRRPQRGYRDDRRPQGGYRNDRRPQQGSRRPSPARRRNSRSRTAIIAIELIVIAVCAVGVIFLFGKSKATNIVEVDSDSEKVRSEMSSEVTENQTMKGYWNIALFGVDTRDDMLDEGTRTDTIIIASINQDNGEVKLCSVYRDTYLNLCSEGKERFSKCNEAYAYGGPDQAMIMLNRNLDMNITDFVTIGFSGLTEVIDKIGGVDISIEENEIEHLNNYQSTMAQKMGVSYDKVTSPGVQKLNGLQATAYCRIRYTAGDDFARAARQREVIQAIMDKASTLDINTLNDAANSVFDKKMATNLKLSQIMDLLKDVKKYHIVAEDGFPQESMRTTGKIDGKSVVAAKPLDSNVVWLHQFLFDENDYKVSDTVREYSSVVGQKTSALGG
jgi:LCP family protein required for cell wall assembly